MTQTKNDKQTKPRRSPSSGDICAKQKLLLAGKKLFAQKGLSATSIRDIANEAQVNSSMISYYFENKIGLYRSCLQDIGEKKLHLVKEILTPPSNVVDFKSQLHELIRHFFTIYLEDRETGLIIVREYDRINSPAEAVFKNTFLKIFDLTIEFFRGAQKNSIIPKDRDAFILASLFFGALSSQMRLDHIKHKTYKRSLSQTKERDLTADHLVKLFL